jgi:hypothetical protein
MAITKKQIAPTLFNMDGGALVTVGWTQTDTNVTSTKDCDKQSQIDFLVTVEPQPNAQPASDPIQDILDEEAKLNKYFRSI